MTDPLGLAWDQPALSEITFYRGKAYMTPSTMEKLLNYSTTVPTGVYPGKMWRSNRGHGQELCWYDEVKNGACSIRTASIVIADPGEVCW